MASEPIPEQDGHRLDVCAGVGFSDGRAISSESVVPMMTQANHSNSRTNWRLLE